MSLFGGGPTAVQANVPIGGLGGGGSNGQAAKNKTTNPLAALGGSMAAGGFMGGQTTNGMGGGPSNLPRTTVINGKAMVEVNGQWVPQDSSQGKAAYSSGATSGTTAPGLPILNTAQKDPRVEAMQNNLASRYNDIKGKENTQDPFLMESVNNLRNRQSTDTTRRAMDQANAGAADQTAGLQSQMQSQAARTGRGSGWGGAEAQGAGQRLAAKQNAQIQMNELGRQDNLALQGANILNQPSALQTAQSGQANNFLLGASGQADQGAKLALAQQGLGLQQWQAGTDANYKQALLNQQGQQGMFDNYLKLLGTVGY